MLFSLRPGDGDSEEDVSLRIQLRSMHRSLAAALMIVAIHSSLDPYSRLRWGHVWAFNEADTVYLHTVILVRNQLRSMRLRTVPTYRKYWYGINSRA